MIPLTKRSLMWLSFVLALMAGSFWGAAGFAFVAYAFPMVVFEELDPDERYRVEIYVSTRDDGVSRRRNDLIDLVMTGGLEHCLVGARLVDGETGTVLDDRLRSGEVRSEEIKAMVRNAEKAEKNKQDEGVEGLDRVRWGQGHVHVRILPNEEIGFALPPAR